MNHLDADLPDEYALGRITDQTQLAAIEEHLSICEECRNLVETVDTIRRALKSDPHGQAATLAQMLEAHRRVIETEMIEQRITDLEAKPENTSRKRAKKS